MVRFVKMIVAVLRHKALTKKNVLNVLNKNEWCDLFLNTWTAVRMLQTILVNVDKGVEHNFSIKPIIAQEKRSNLYRL